MKVIETERIDLPELAPYFDLTGAQLKGAREGEGIFIAESMNVIRSALTAGFEPLSLLAGKKQLEGVRGALGGTDIAVFTAPDRLIEELTGYRLHRGVLAAFRRKPLPSPSEVLRGARRAAVLENVVDPTNVGAIFRSAAALGMDAVLVSDSCCDPLHRRALRVSTGTVFLVPWAMLPAPADDKNAADTGVLRELGFKTAALALTDDSVSIKDPALKAEEKLALILGTEGEGLRPRTIEGADYTVRIPMRHGADSLNVAAAAAVAFWELAEDA